MLTDSAVFQSLEQTGRVGVAQAQGSVAVGPFLTQLPEEQ
jgi:hypothetical protein